MAKINLILGGARSGKSRLAEQRALHTGLPRTYIATAAPGDDEMAERIRQHQIDRGNQWHTVEEPLNLAKILEQSLEQEGCILVDCLTLWLSNALHQAVWQEQKKAFLDLLVRAAQSRSSSQILLVSNETGLGVVPMGELSRRFVDESGFLHQEIATIAQQVTWVVAGLPTELKSQC